MNENKPQAVAATPDVDKSRNVSGGYSMWAQIYPFLNFIMFILGWFTVPFEVLFRRNFGQRWLTVINFYVGFMVLFVFTSLQTLSGAFSSNNYYSGQQGAQEPPLWDRLMSKSMLLFFFAYLLIGSYHFFRMWWRDRTNTALQSFDYGTSRFEPLAVPLMRLINIAAVPMIRVYMLLLPKEEQRRNIKVPPLLNDPSAFTNTVIEPLVLIILVFIFPGITRTWLLVSAAALAVYANWIETAQLNKALDFRDSVIEARDMMNHRYLPENNTTETLIIRQALDTIKENPELAPVVTKRHPDLMSIIEEMNNDSGHLRD